MKSELTFMLGQVLVEAGKITSDQLQNAIKTSRKTGNRLKDILVDRGYITESELEILLAKKLNTPALSLHG